MTTYVTDVATKNYKQNIVIEFDDGTTQTYFSTYQPDSGLTVDSDKVGLLRRATVSPTKVDVKSVNTTIANSSFELVDADEAVTAFIATDPQGQLMGNDVTIYVGRITGASPWADYSQIAKGKIKKITKTSNGYRFNIAENVDQLNNSIFNTKTDLTVAANDSQGTLTVTDTTDFPTTGTIKVGDEFMTYTGKTATTITGMTRAQLSSTAGAHDVGSEVLLVTSIQDNPINLILQLLISNGGGGTYDVLTDGIGISPTLIDVAGFEAIRDSDFSGEQYQLYLYDIENALKLIEKQLLLSTFTRLIPKGGKIGLALLDQVNLGASVTDIDETSIIGNPTYDIDSNKIINQVEIAWDYDEGTKQFLNRTLYQDTTSISDYGAKQILKYEFKGVRTSLSGSTIIENLQSRLLARLSNPRARVSVKTQMDRSLEDPGDNIKLTHRYLPKPGAGTLGMSGTYLEVMSKALNFDTGQTTYTLEFTSSSNLRLGLIAPSPLPTSVTSQTIFDVPDGSCYAVDDTLKLWDDSSSAYYADATVTITDVTSNTITVSPAFVTTLNTTNTRIKLADYDEASTNQRDTYGYIAPDTGTFVSDGSNAYVITF